MYTIVQAITISKGTELEIIHAGGELRGNFKVGSGLL